MIKIRNNKQLIAASVIGIPAVLLLSVFLVGINGYLKERAAVRTAETTLPEDAPIFNISSGFYAGPFELTISYPNPDAQIYCTFDGSVPTEDSEPYTGGFVLDNRSGYSNYLSAITGINPNEDYIPGVSVIKGNVIRAVAVLPDGRTSRVASGTYFIGIDRVAAFGQAPVISLYTDADNLFSYEDGIYVLGKTYDEWLSGGQDDSAAGDDQTAVDEPVGNFSNRGDEWERPATVEYMPGDGSTGFVSDIGIRIMGGASRSNSQKSFRLKCRKKYGSKYIDYDLIPGNLRSDGTGEVSKYRSFILRNGGNDCDYGKIRDPFIQEMVSTRDFETQDSEPVVVFINGEYWGCYTLVEDYSGEYIENNYGISEDNVIIVKNGKIEEGFEEDMPSFYEMEEFIMGNDMSIPANYSVACDMLDMESFASYCALNIYICNKDSIFVNDNNWEMWRVRRIDKMHPCGDGKWRMMCFDTDYSSGIYEDVGVNEDIMGAACDENNTATGSRLLGALLANNEFRDMFITELCDMRNLDFERNRVCEVVEKYRAQYGLLVPYSLIRFGPESIARFMDPNKYVSDCIDGVEQWFTGRYEVFPEQIKRDFGLSDCVSVTVVQPDISKGSFTLNNSNLEKTGEYNGLYFREVPVTVTARPADGEVFDHWQVEGGTVIDSEGDSITFIPDGECIVTAVYD